MQSGGSSSSTPANKRSRRRVVSATLVYDADCSTCARFAAAVRKLDRKGRVKLASMHDPTVEARLRPLMGDAFDASFHLILEPTGEVLSGDAALHDLAKLLPAVRPFAEVVFALPGVRRLPGAFYGTISRGRHCEICPAPK